MTLELEDAPARRRSPLDFFGFTPAEFARALPAGVAGAVVGFAAMILVGSRITSSDVLGFLLAVAGLAGGFVAGMRIVRVVSYGTANTIASAVMPSGKTTPARADFSREDALLMQRDVAGALASFEEKIAADPADAAARLRAADLYAKEGGDPRRAEALFREVQRIPGVSLRDDVYASTRLVDLYDGPLEDTGRALVELRRIVDRHPGTRAADEARSGLKTLKARLHGSET